MGREILSQHDHIDSGPTEALIKPALEKTGIFIRALYQGNLPARLQNRLNMLSTEQEQFITIQKENDNSPFASDDPRHRNLVGYYNPETDHIYLPKSTREPHIIHEMMHFLSAHPDRQLVGFDDKKNLWRTYFNEGFTDLLTKYAYLGKPAAFLQAYTLKDNVETIISTYINGIADPNSGDVRSYQLAFEKVLHILSQNKFDTGHRQLIPRLTEAFFNADFDSAMKHLSTFTVTDYSPMHEYGAPQPREIPLSEYAKNTFQKLEQEGMYLFRSILAEELPLKGGIFPSKQQKSENRVLRNMIDLLTGVSVRKGITVTFEFPEFIHDGGGIVIVLNPDSNMKKVVVNTQLFELARYLKSYTISTYSELHEAFRLIFIQAAKQLVEHSGISSKDIAHAVKSIESRINEKPQYAADTYRLANAMNKDPDDPALEHLIRQRIGYDFISEGKININENRVRSADQKQRNEMKEKYSEKQRKQSANEERRTEKKLEQTIRKCQRKDDAYYAEITRLNKLRSSNKIDGTEYDKRKAKTDEKYGFTPDYFADLKKQSEEVRTTYNY